MKLQALVALAASAAIFTLPVVAQDASSSQANPAVAQTAPGNNAADILKMLDAGVSTDVIKTYIRTSPGGWNLGASDLITLKQRGVADDLTVELLNHHAPVSSAQQMPIAPIATSAPQTIVVRTARPDPEGYDFFQHYYLFPRTLAYANQTLGYAPYYSYGYGYPRRFGGPSPGYRPYPFGP
jgi:hypothetical protein